MLVRHTTFEKIKQSTIHVVLDLSSSCTGIVSDVVRCRNAFGTDYVTFRELTVHVFGEFQARLRMTQKAPISCMSVRPFVLVDGFFMRFDIEKFYANLLTNSTFGSKTLHEDISTFILLTVVRNILYFEDNA
jgi:hypothetical protein